MASMAAIDLGAQSGRVAVGRFDGERLTVDVVHRFPNVPVEVRGTLYWDILALYRETLDGLRAAALHAGSVDSLGIDSWAVDFGFVDRRGRLLQNPVHYRDVRRAEALDRVLAAIPARELYERTGIQILGINTLCELTALAVDDDPALAAAETLLLVPDLFHYWLSGARVSEFTNATTTQLVDARTRAWADDLAARVGVRSELFTELVQPGTRLGSLDADSVEDAAFARTELVAVGTHDTASAVAAVPFRRNGSAYISAGTWSLVGVERSEPTITDATFAANLTNEGGVDGTYRLLGNVTGLWLLHECRRAWALAGTDYTFDRLVALADEVPAHASFVDPNDASFAAPGDMPHRIRAACAATGQAIPEGPAEIARCVLESIALRHAHALDAVAAVTGARPPEVHVVGGGARNAALCRYTASASGIPVLAGPEEATLIGNLLQQAMTLGEIGSVSEAREVVRASFPVTIHEPADGPAWKEARERFARIAALRAEAAVA